MPKNVNQLIFEAKERQLESEELTSHFANNFSILEPNNYDDDEAIFSKELREAASASRLRIICV